MSAVLGGPFLAGTAPAAAAGAGPQVVEALAWLGLIDLLLAVFNLIPAASLDGGRVLCWTADADRRAPVLGADSPPLRCGITG